MNVMETFQVIDKYIERTGETHGHSINAFVQMGDETIIKIGQLCKAANDEDRKLTRGEVRKVKEWTYVPPGIDAGEPQDPNQMED